MLSLATRRSGPGARRRGGRWREPVTIRMASPRDAEALIRLAERDSRRVPRGPRLLAERDGRIEAVMSVSTGEFIADPFRPTAELVELLRWARA